ncbi:hypothetical protein ATJ93_4762 [Halopiger aswanensis]|uniref:Uncharacterized protein n=1 Tax=Halopiger aswanensis TaxID=148449 RepID=A0A3R7DA22_9EURY|nr:hypothetical protein ATJ93_4762 [Halopiger aswanensis]
MEGNVSTLLKDLDQFLRIIGWELQFLLTKRTLYFWREIVPKREVIRNPNDTDLCLREIAVSTCSRKLIQNTVVIDVVNFVEND